MGGDLNIRHPGVMAALAAALLFGASTPVAKRLLEGVGPWMLAALFYLGSGIGLMLVRRINGVRPVRLPRGEVIWLAAAIVAGGIIGPILLMSGLSHMPASGAALLLNSEGVLTALLAWIVFKENVDTRIVIGMAAIAVGSVILSWPGNAQFSGTLPALLVIGACLAWAIDNNLTRKVSLADAGWIAMIKGTVAGSINLILALAMGERLPPMPVVSLAMVIGFLAYGISLVLFVVGMRHLGTARAGAYFSVAPFFGAILAISMGEPVTTPLLMAGILMAFGVWLHLTERHVHEHRHEAIEHCHEHVHDEHHQHLHDPPVTPGTKHAHCHTHQPMVHTHRHFPDAHHQGHKH